MYIPMCGGSGGSSVGGGSGFKLTITLY